MFFPSGLNHGSLIRHHPTHFGPTFSTRFHSGGSNTTRSCHRPGYADPTRTRSILRLETSSTWCRFMAQPLASGAHSSLLLCGQPLDDDLVRVLDIDGDYINLRARRSKARSSAGVYDPLANRVPGDRECVPVIDFSPVRTVEVHDGNAGEFHLSDEVISRRE
ncbi:hypothetical protein PanWU01x14_244500 [Parasponia andersonii]|uniref:Uncharacterized protein n=1 Tax=Parasponia andersonii TaxID=3476 RepID=A0A2P5BF36_PARAD|nr:hypothetical protein PanWU01x14_244500 [Parasponia andersonii]